MKEEVLVLKLRDLIASKELMVAQANRDLAQFGHWGVDYAGHIQQHLDPEISKVLNQIEAMQ